jgi:hypothetical protein
MNANFQNLLAETLLKSCRAYLQHGAMHLAARLKHEAFKHWVQSELDGYFGSTDLPNYRKFHSHCFGHFAGPFQRANPLARA